MTPIDPRQTGQGALARTLVLRATERGIATLLGTGRPDEAPRPVQTGAQPAEAAAAPTIRATPAAIAGLQTAQAHLPTGAVSAEAMAAYVEAADAGRAPASSAESGRGGAPSASPDQAAASRSVQPGLPAAVGLAVPQQNGPARSAEAIGVAAQGWRQGRRSSNTGYAQGDAKPRITWRLSLTIALLAVGLGLLVVLSA